MERTVVFAKDKIITPENLPDLFMTPREAADPAPAPVLSESAGLDLKEQTLAFQRHLIETALARANGVQKTAAALLGLKPTTLNEMIKRLDIPAGNY